MNTYNYRRTNQIIAAIIFLSSLIVYTLTMAPTTSFWDCGEFIAVSHTLGVPHPPGTPLYLLLGSVFSQIPLFTDIGARVNFLSPIASALSVMFLYLITVQLIEKWRGKTYNISDAIIAYGSAFVGALTFAFTDSHWFNAVEAEVYSISTFFTAIVVWLILKWEQSENTDGNVKYILIIAYILGLATGIHLLNLLTLPFIALVIYFKKHSFSIPSFLSLMAITLGVFLTIYLGIIKGIPNLTEAYGIKISILFVLLLFTATYFAIKAKKSLLSTILTSMVLIFIGYSTYATIFIRANQHPAINENNPDTAERAVKYMNRDQYGDWSIIDRASSIARSDYSHRYTENAKKPTTTEVTSFVWNYQIKEMYLRYFAWQFIGRGDDNWALEDKNGKTIKMLDGINPSRYIIPLAFLLGIAGLGHHFYKDWKRALAVLALFIVTGLLIILYLNQYDPQPRERDYSYVGSFFTFAIWIGIGIAGLLERIKEIFGNTNKTKYISIATISALFFMMPVFMMSTDYKEHSRVGNYVAWDYAYNLLNSCEPNGIVFTNGDNDTFPLWYIQEVEKIRKDVRVVNLSLLNTPWYIRQLKNEEPKIDIKISDKNIDLLEKSELEYAHGNMSLVTKWAIQKWTGLWSSLTGSLIQQTGGMWSLKNDGLPIRWGPAEAKIQLNNATITTNLKPSIAGMYIRVQDFMVLEIIADVIETRPIYFAATVSPGSKVGLDRYCQMEGMVYKVFSNPVSRTNKQKMLTNITQSENLDIIIRTAEDYQNYNIGNGGYYRYRNLNNPDVYFDSNIKRLTTNYRFPFLQMAIESINSFDEKTGESEALVLLKMMDSYFPPDVLPINNFELELQISDLYLRAGGKEESQNVLSRMAEYNITMQNRYAIGQRFWMDHKNIEKAELIFISLYNDYPNVYDIMITLVQLYAQEGQNAKAVSILSGWLINNPNDKKAQEMLNMLKRQSA